MTPTRVSRGGSYGIDRIYTGLRLGCSGRPHMERNARCCRLWIASGAKTLREHGKRVALVDQLYETGRLDILRALNANRVTMAEVYALHLQGRLGLLSTDVILHRPLADEVRRFLATYRGAKPVTVQRYAASWAALQRTGVLLPTARVRDLADVDWPALQQCWPGREADWNHLRRFLSRFLTVMEPEGRVPDLTPQSFWQIVAQMPPHLQAAPVALLATGMRVGEFVRCHPSDLRPHDRGLRHLTPSMTRRYAMQRDRQENARVIADVLLVTRPVTQSRRWLRRGR